MDGWKTCFLLGWPIFRGELLVLGRVSFSVRLVKKLGLKLRVLEIEMDHGKYTRLLWIFPKIGVGPQNGWFIRKNPILIG